MPFPARSFFSSFYWPHRNAGTPHRNSPSPYKTGIRISGTGTCASAPGKIVSIPQPGKQIPQRKNRRRPVKTGASKNPGGSYSRLFLLPFDGHGAAPRLPGRNPAQRPGEPHCGLIRSITSGRLQQQNLRRNAPYIHHHKKITPQPRVIFTSGKTGQGAGCNNPSIQPRGTKRQIGNACSGNLQGRIHHGAYMKIRMLPHTPDLIRHSGHGHGGRGARGVSAERGEGKVTPISPVGPAVTGSAQTGPLTGRGVLRSTY